MKCPKCITGQLKITHSFSCESRGAVKRGVCRNCGVVVTVQEVIVFVAPKRGQGAHAFAHKIKRASTSVPEEAPRKEEHL